MKRTLLLSLAFCPLFVHAKPALLRLSIPQALDYHIIKIEATATGSSYHDKALRLHITNTSGNQLQLTMSQGAIFRPGDASQQDLVLAGDEPLKLEAFKDGTVDAQTFSAKSDGTAPVAAQPYTFYKMGSDTLVALLQFIKSTHQFDFLGQEAVWVVTDHHPLESVYDAMRDLPSNRMVDRLVALTGRPAPQYHEVHPDQPVYAAKPTHIIVKLEQKLDAAAKLTLGVFDRGGTMVQKVVENQSYGAKVPHRFTADFATADVAAGTYYIRLKNGDAVLQEVPVTVP